LSRFFNRFDETSVEQLYQANQELLDKVHAHRGAESLILDLDSTHADTYGDEEETAFNAHYGTVGFHPIVAFDGMTRECLKAQLRAAYLFTSNGVVPSDEPVLERDNDMLLETTAFVRGDSGFAVTELYELCEEESVSYEIRLNANANVKKLADELRPT